MVLDTTSLVAYYACDENAANTTVSDSHGSNDGTASVNTSTMSSTAHGNLEGAFDIDGASETITFTDTNDLDFGTGAFTINFWFKSNSTGSFSILGKQKI